MCNRKEQYVKQDNKKRIGISRLRTAWCQRSTAEIEIEMYCVKGILDVVTTSDDYWTCSFEGKAFARKTDGLYRTITASETASS